MTRKYKTRQFQAFYDSIRKLAADRSSEFWYNGEPHRGAGHRCSYWDGRSCLKRHARARTFSDVAYQAGLDDAKAKGAPKFVTELRGTHPYTREISA